MKNINEVDTNDIDMKPFKVKDKLNPEFFNEDGQLDSQIRLKLLDIADDFVESLEVKWVKPSDIVLTGSIANYNWSKYSDVDIHIVYNFSDIYKKTDFVKDYFNSKKELWNSTHTELTIKDFPVEISVEDSSDPAKSTGVYSLEKNKWVKEPENLNDSKLNKEYIKSFCAKQMTKLDDLFDKLDNEDDKVKMKKLSTEVENIYTKLKNMRSEGLASSEKEMSTGNIIWKVIKHMGYIEKLWNYINNVYDRSNTIDEVTGRIVRITEKQAKLLKEDGNPGYGNVYLNSWLGRFKKALKCNTITTADLHDAVQRMGIKQITPGVYSKRDLEWLLTDRIAQLKKLLNIEAQPTPEPIQPNTPEENPFRTPEPPVPEDDGMPAANMDNFINLSDVSELNEGLCELSSKTYQSAASKAYNKGKYDIDDADDRVKKFRQAAIDQLRSEHPYYFHHLNQDREDKQEEYVTNNNNQKIIIFDPDYSTLQDLYKGVKQGKLLIHCREIDENDIPNILYPEVGETVQDAYGCEYGEEEMPNLIFASENFNWAQNYPGQHSNYSDHRNGVFFVYGDNFEKNIGDGYIQDITGQIYRSGDTPLTVETDDWFSSEPVDVAGVLIINNNKLNNKLNESLCGLSDIDDIMCDIYDNDEMSPEQILISFKNKRTKTQDWNPLIKPLQYQNALRQYMQYGDAMRFPEETVDEWLHIIIVNTMRLKYNTDFAGHSRYFPTEEIIDVLGEEYNEWCKEHGVDNEEDDFSNYSEFLEEIGFYDWLKLPDGSDAWSDYGLDPLFKILSEYRSDMSVGEKLILVNRCLDVYHCRGNLSSAFIGGGDDTLTKVSNNELFENIHRVNEAAMPQFNLQTLSSIKSFAGRLKYCKQMLGPTFGSGSSRIIFEIDDEKVLKLAKNQKGLAQNEFEEETSRYGGMVVKVFECADDCSWLVEENCIPAKEKDFEQIIGLPFETYCDLVRWYYSRYSASDRHPRLFTMTYDEADALVDKLYEEDDYGFVPRIFNLMGDYQLPFGDLTRISTYGMVNRDGEPEIVVIDSGLSEEILDTYYRRH